jgi:hypothetical protein
VTFTPHQAVAVTFEWDGISDITYAIQCEDFASDSGYEYVGTARPQLGDGALIVAFDDGMGTVTSAPEWRVFVSTFGPTDTSIDAGCSPENLDACVVEDRGIPNGWTKPDFDDWSWQPATEYTPAQAGWGRAPKADVGRRLLWHDLPPWPLAKRL